jgi:hypothetical protein
MANVCSRCGTDNADGALVCRQCGASLASPAGWSRSLIPDDDNFDPLSAPTLVMHHTVPSELPPLEDILIPPEPEPSRFRPRLMLGLAAFAVLLGGAVWLMRPASQAPAPAPAVVAPAASLPVLVAAEPPPAPATSLPASAAGASAAPAPMAPVVAASAAPAAPAAPSAPERRKRIPEPVGRKQAAEATPAAAPVVEPPVAAPAPVASPAPLPAPEPVKPKSVTELCSAGNLLTRGFCEHRECAKAEYSGDPVCVRIKEAEEARRFRQ